MNQNLTLDEFLLQIKKNNKGNQTQNSVELRGNIGTYSAIVSYSAINPYNRHIFLGMKSGGNIDSAQFGFHDDDEKRLEFWDSAKRQIFVKLPMDMFEDCFSILKSALNVSLIVSYDPNTYLLTEFMLASNSTV